MPDAVARPPGPARIAAPLPDPGRPASDDVRAMFDRIAGRYERMNTVMTLGLDRGWRRAAVAAARLARGGTALDVACGSGSLTRALAEAVGPTGSVVGVDLSEGMLAVARARPSPPRGALPVYRRGDATALPVGDAAFDVATIAFGLRNVEDRPAAVRELVRAVRPGGRVVVLELARPTSPAGRFVEATWFRRIVPVIGRLAGGGSAYRYLPASVRAYPAPRTVAGWLRDAGLGEVDWWRLGLGTVTVHAGTKGR